MSRLNEAFLMVASQSLHLRGQVVGKGTVPVVPLNLSIMLSSTLLLTLQQFSCVVSSSLSGSGSSIFARGIRSSFFAHYVSWVARLLLYYAVFYFAPHSAAVLLCGLFFLVRLMVRLGVFGLRSLCEQGCSLLGRSNNNDRVEVVRVTPGSNVSLPPRMIAPLSQCVA